MVTRGSCYESRDPVRALDEVEAYLRGAGFFGPDPARGLRADLYLGYGLSEAMRRVPSAARPEPVPDLPLVACRISPSNEPAGMTGHYRVGEWERTWSASEYRRAVAQAREAIAAGEIYQVNLVQHLAAPFEGDPAAVAAALAGLAPLHPRPLAGDGWAIVSATPEVFLERHGQRLRTMPIKGTRPKGGAKELRASVKDAAEHVMIVDLERNDLGRVCQPGSVRWPVLMKARPMAGVEHLVSTVEGIAREGLGLADTLRVMFPGGSVTGAPKIAALDHINALEPVGRGASMGALGTIWPNGDFELALTIRTFAISDGRIHLWVGGGVVWDSDPAAEVAELWVKAGPLLDALASGARTREAA